jgi:hypothetical protein
LTIKNIQKKQNCGSKLCSKVITFDKILSKKDIIFLAKNDNLILNDDFYKPYFKIISPNYIIRGSLGIDRITIEFQTENGEICNFFLNELIDFINKK